MAIASIYMTCVLHSSISTKLHPLATVRSMVSGNTKRPNVATTPVPRDIHRVQGSQAQVGSSPASPNSAPGTPSNRASPALPSGSSTAEPSLPTPTLAPAAPSPRDEIINFLAGLNVSLELVANVCQQMMSMYDLWDCFTDLSDQDRNRREARADSHREFLKHQRANTLTTTSMPSGGNESIMSSVLLREKELVTDRGVVEILLRMRRDRDHDIAFGNTARLNTTLVRASREPE